MINKRKPGNKGGVFVFGNNQSETKPKFEIDDSKSENDAFQLEPIKLAGRGFSQVFSFYSTLRGDNQLKRLKIQSPCYFQGKNSRFKLGKKMRKLKRKKKLSKKTIFK